jgi:hypothetical protein
MGQNLIQSPEDIEGGPPPKRYMYRRHEHLFHNFLLGMIGFLFLAAITAGIFFMCWHPNHLGEGMGRPTTEGAGTGIGTGSPRVHK